MTAMEQAILDMLDDGVPEEYIRLMLSS